MVFALSFLIGTVLFTFALCGLVAVLNERLGMAKLVRQFIKNYWVTSQTQITAIYQTLLVVEISS
jgi:hypothetical protein